MRVLTIEQRKIIEENHDLIHKFAKIKRLPIDEYYDVLAFGLCRAAKYYDEKKGQFISIAYCCMKSEVCNYQKKLNNKIIFIKKDIEKISSNADKNAIDNMLNYDILKSFLNKKELQILKYVISGFSQQEISNILNCKQQNIAYHIKKIKDKLFDYYIKDKKVQR